MRRAKEILDPTVREGAPPSHHTPNPEYGDSSNGWPSYTSERLTRAPTVREGAHSIGPYRPGVPGGWGRAGGVRASRVG